MKKMLFLMPSPLFLGIACRVAQVTVGMKHSIAKWLIISAVLLAPIAVGAQVTIGANQLPKATLDVVASKTNGTTAEGIIAPRLTSGELADKNVVYTIDQTGAIVYVSSIVPGTAGGKTVNVNAVGYYYFDGSLWQKLLSETPVYTASNGLTQTGNDVQLGGTLTKNTTINQSAYSLTYSGTGKNIITTPWQYNYANATPGDGRILTSDANGNATWKESVQFQSISDLFEVIPTSELTTSIPGQDGTFTIQEQESYRAGNIMYFSLKISWLGTSTVRVGSTGSAEFNYNPNVVDFGLVRVKQSYSMYYPFRKALFTAQVGGDENNSSAIALVDNAGATLMSNFNKYSIICGINYTPSNPTYKRGWIQVEQFLYPGFAYKCPNATTPIVYYISGFYLING